MTIFGGMLAATTIGLILTPGLYFVIQRLSERLGRQTDEKKDIASETVHE